MKKIKRQRKGRTTIRRKILKSVIMIVSISLVVLGTTACILNYKSTTDTLEQSMTQMAKLAAERIEQQLTAYRNIAAELGSVARIADPLNSNEAKQSVIDQKVKDYNLVRGKFIGSDGIAPIDGTDYSDRDYFKASMKGETYITEPLLAKTTDKMSLIISAPVWEGGIQDTTIIGVVFVVPSETLLNDIVKSINISSGGSAYMLDSKGITIAHQNEELVAAQSNTMEDAKSDSSLASIAELETKMLNGESGFGTYTYAGVKKLMSYAPLSGVNGWSVAVNAPVSDFLGSTILSMIIVIVLLAVSIIITIFIVRKLAGSIGTPIALCAERLNLLSQGDLKTAIPNISTNDETGLLADSTKNIVNSINTMIGDISRLLQEMSLGNFDVHSEAESSYAGDFSVLLTAIQEINGKLSDTLYRIKSGAEQVSLGSNQLAESASSLAEGATEQAGAVEQLFATVSDVTNQVQENASGASLTSKEAGNIGIKAQESTDQVQMMTQAMARINDASKQISHIIKTIESIAAQTNLLSLNAAIEAARAGEAGKGFAVVADEIRKLANQSAEAVDETRKLIETALHEVESGNGIVEQTSVSLQAVISGIENIVHSIKVVADSSTAQSKTMEQINQGIEQISEVVQANSAVSEEGSATSQELAAEASNLMAAIEQFKLRS